MVDRQGRGPHERGRRRRVVLGDPNVDHLDRLIMQQIDR